MLLIALASLGCAVDCPTGYDPGPGRTCLQQADLEPTDRPTSSDTPEPEPTSTVDETGATGDTGAPEPEPTWFACDSDDVTLIPASGQINVHGDTFLPLCSGEVLLPNGDAGVVRIGLPNAQLGAWSTPTVAEEMALDPNAGLVWLGDVSSSVSRIDLATDAVTTTATGASTSNLAVTDEGWLLVEQQSPNLFGAALRIVDAAGAVVDSYDLPEPYAPGFMAYDPVNELVILAEAGLSPSTLYRYRFDPVTHQVAFADSLWNAGTNGEDLAVSADGAHLAHPCGGGSGTGYTVHDFDPTDFSVRGEWDTGAYPRAAAFSPDSTRLLASNGSTVFLFDTSTHAALLSWDPPQCGLGVYAVAFSRGGDIAYTFSSCDFSGDDGLLSWRVLAP